MRNKIRLGFIGANVDSHWASHSHFPALLASPDVELTAVCTTNAASAEAARRAFGARLAFSDYREMVVCPEIDAVAVVVRVPSHYGPTKAAIDAGKHVYTEWPLGRTTAEAVELTAMARDKGVQTAVGLQSRANPVLQTMKELLESGYVGEMLTCHVRTIRAGSLERHSTRAWQHDVTLGANPLTIASGHVIDALRFVAGGFTSLGAMVTTQVKQWYETDTRRTVDVTAPDNIMLMGRLAGGAVASVHVGTVPCAPSGYRMEIYGREGTLVVSGKISPNHMAPGETLVLQGAKRGQELQDIAIPQRLALVPENFPRGIPYSIGQMYALFAESVRSGRAPAYLPTFDTAVELHHILDDIRSASETGRTVSVVSNNAK